MIYERQIGKSRVSYDSESGLIIWIVAYKKPWLTGELATREMPNGYLYIKADNKFHSASRLAVELVTNTPVPCDMEVDHKNRIKSDNRFINLRVVDSKTNKANAIKRIGVTGISGVSIYTRPSGNGILYRIKNKSGTKYYKTLEEAKAALS